jgi:hypothetical protein
MSLWTMITGWVSRETRRYIYAPIGRDRVIGSEYDSEPLRARRDYLRVWLVEMCLKNDREWFVSWHPAVHCIIRFQFGSTQVDIPNVAGEFNLPNVSQQNLDRVVQLNYPMTTLLPFNGGTVDLTAGLLALEGTNLVRGFIKTIGDFAGLLMVPQLSMAVSVAAPIASGLEQLLTAANGGLHLGLHQTFADAGGGGANELRPGYIAVVLAEDTKLNPETLWVKDDRLHVGTSESDLRGLAGFAFMLFRIEKRTDRPDWEGLTAIRKPYDSALGALVDKDWEKAETFLRAAIAQALRSPDLTQADRIRVARTVKDEYDQAKGQGLSATAPEVPTLSAVMGRSISADQALALGEPSFAELFS